MDVKQLYNQEPQTAWVSWCQLQLESVGWSSSYCSRQWEPAPDRGLGPSVTPGWAAQQNAKEVLRKLEELGVNMLQSVPSPTHLSHITNITPFATLSRIKCEGYIFLKKCVRSSLLLTMFPCIVVYVLCGYTTVWNNPHAGFYWFWPFVWSSRVADPVVSSHTRPCGHFTSCTKIKTKQQTEGGMEKQTITDLELQNVEGEVGTMV